MLKRNKIALIYFSRSSKAEARAKSFGKSTTNNQKRALTSFLNKRSISLLESKELDILYFDENNQKGRTFGEKLANAFHETFELGYEGAISVGNDCVDLDKINFRNIVEELSIGINTLGPTYRNGVYLIALHHASFDKKSFSNLAWQTNQLKADLIVYFTKLGQEYSVLQTYHDINNFSDLSKILSTSKLTARLRVILNAFISFVKVEPRPYLSLLQLFSFSSNFGLRAPPQN